MPKFIVGIVDFKPVMKIVSADAFRLLRHLFQGLQSTFCNLITSKPRYEQCHRKGKEKDLQKLRHPFPEGRKTVAEPYQNGASLHGMDVTDERNVCTVGDSQNAFVEGPVAFVRK